MLDGIVFSGGIDIDPAVYGAERHPATDPAQAHRDAGELATARGSARARSSDARDLPRLPAAERPPRRRPRPAPAGGGRTRGPPRDARCLLRAPRRGEGGTRLAVDPRPTPRLGAVEPPPGRRPGGRGAGRERLRRGRLARGARGSLQALCAWACSGTPRWRQTTSACSRRSSTKRARIAPPADRARLYLELRLRLVVAPQAPSPLESSRRASANSPPGEVEPLDRRIALPAMGDTVRHRSPRRSVWHSRRGTVSGVGGVGSRGRTSDRRRGREAPSPFRPCRATPPGSRLRTNTAAGRTPRVSAARRVPRSAA